MAAMSKLSNANAPTEGESQSVAGSTNSKYYFKVFMKGAVLIVGVAGTAWTVERAIGYATAKTNTITEALLEERHGKTSKAPTAKAVKTNKGGEKEEEDSSGPTVLAKSEGELALDNLEWPPECSFGTDEECEASFCSGLQTVLKENLCPAVAKDCEVAVTCEPEVITRARKLGVLETKIQRALQSSHGMPFFISFNIACATADCSDVTTADVDELVAQTETALTGLDSQAFLDQLTAAIATQDPAPEGFTFSFTFDPASSTISDAVTTSIPAGYEFVGEGACIPESTNDPDGIPYYTSYIERDGSGYSITECATWCDNLASEPCWVQNQAEAPYRGMDYTETGICFCLFQTSTTTKPYNSPSFICTLPAGAIGTAEAGVGQIVATDCTATHPTYVYECLNDYSCFKYIG